MSGGRLVVLDRLGRDVKAYPLEEGLATIGSDPVCDIRVMLPTVSPHHATVVVHANQTVVRSVSAGETLVNGAAISVAALRHRDVLTVGGRALRWEYTHPSRPRPLAPQPALVRRAVRSRARRRGSEPAARNVLIPTQRASMPASSGGKQVAIVQPQRRDTNEQTESSRSAAKASTKRPRSSRNDEQDSINDAESSTRKASPRSSPKSPQLNDTTKATLWIESRKTPLRLTALRAAHRARHAPVAKIRAPSEIDHTKQAALMLMTGHTPKSKQSPKNKTPSFVVKKPSPVRKTPKGRKSSPKKTPRVKKSSVTDVTPKRNSVPATRASMRASGDNTGSILEITDSDSQTIRGSNVSGRSARKSSMRSPALPSPKKSALKDPSAKKSTRKTESIKFDLSNLESNAQDRSSDILFITETTKDNSYNSVSEDDLSLHYSDTSATQSPSPRKSIHSRSSRILEKSLGTTFTQNTSTQENSTLTPVSPRSRKSLRGSLIVQKALESSNLESSRYSRRTTKSVSDQSYNTTVASVRKTKTLSPRSSNQNLETYSIVDLVSIDSNESGRSVYNSAASNNTTVTFDTPQTIASRKTRSNNPSLLGSSTPYLNRTSSPKPSPDVNKSRISNITTRRSGSMTTPENTTKHTPFNSTRISKASRSRSRINDSDILLVDNENDDVSPKSSRRSKSGPATPIVRKNISITVTPSQSPGTVTPTNRHSPEEATTPVLSIQSLLDQSALSQTSTISNQSQTRTRSNLKRKTIGANVSQAKKIRTSVKSKSLNLSSRRSMRARKSSDSFNSRNQAQENEKVETPKSAVKLVQEGVKNKHSTAKKPTSKRSIIDNLDESDFVKQLFNSPVKRKLSQSMTEFSRKQLFDDDNLPPSRPTRKTTALTGRTPDNSIINQSEAFTPEVFVSPLSTPGNSPNLSGIKRLFAKNTPENDLRNVRGVKSLLRTPPVRKSIRNDLSKVSGVKKVFARSPRNRLSDVRVKEVFAPSPKNDLRRVSGVKSLFQSTRKPRSPKNTLEDVRGVKNLFRKSPRNDLRSVSGVKKGLRINSPRNDLTDVRGVKQLYRDKAPHNDLSDVSGVEELFHEPQDLDTTFDQLIGKPRVRSYTKSKSMTNINKPTKQTRNAKSLHDSISLITNNVEEWLENELKKRVHKPNDSTPKKSISKSNITRELQKLTTDTIEGSLPIRTSRARNSTLTRTLPRQKSASELYSAHTLPIKKRSLVEIVNKSGNESIKKISIVELNKSGNSKNRLPIKKRMVVHSTPVKGRVNMTMNASELGRVSPIAAVDKTRDVDTTAGTTQPTKASPKPKPTKARNTKLPEVPTIEEPKLSPRKTRGKVSVQNSPVQARATRGRKTKEPAVTNTKKRRSSIVITKKPPVMSPKPDPTNTKTIENISENPKKRSTRQKPQEKVQTPKKTRAKVNVKTVTITKPSPQVKARATRQARNVPEANNEITTTRRGEKTIDNSKEVKKPEPVKRTRKTNENEAKTKNAVVKQAPAKRGRKNLTIENDKPNKRTRTTQEKVVTQSSVESEPKTTRGRKTKDSTIPETNKRQRKITIEEPKTKDIEVPRQTRRGTKTDNIEPTKKANTSDVKKGRGRKTTEKQVEASPKANQKGNISDVKKGRGRRTIAKEVQVSPNKTVNQKDASGIKKTRGRKTTETEVKASPKKAVAKAANKKVDTSEVKKGRGRKTIVEKEVEAPTVKVVNKKGDISEVKKTRGRKTAEKQVEAPVTGRRTKKTVVEEVEVKPTRGRKTTATTEEAPKPGGRKRKTKEESAIEEAASEAKKRRTTRAAVQVEATQRTASRSRRR